MADEGNNDSGTNQGNDSQGTGDQQGNNNQSAGTGSNQGTDNAISLEEHNRVKTALSEVLAKKDKYKGSLEAMEKKLEEIEKKAAASAVDPKEQEQKYLDIIAAKDKKLTDVVFNMQKEKVSSSVKSIATRLKCVDPEQVLRQVKPDIIFDEAGRAVIDDGKGEAAVNQDTGKAITIEEHVTAVMKKYTNLVQSSGNTGAGGSQGSSGGTGDYTPEQIAEISRNPVEWAKHKHKIQAQAEKQAGMKPRRRL